MDDLTKRNSPDDDLVNLNQRWEIATRCERWGCTEAQLREAVRLVGNSAKKLGHYFWWRRERPKLAPAVVALYVHFAFAA